MTPDDVMPVTRPPKSWGTLLLEIGVVVAIIALLIGLLLPNVAKVRTPAARAHDANNLKQLGLGQHNYADNNQDGLLGPYAQISPGVMNTELSFRVSLLPYMEESDTYRRIDLTQPWDSPRNALATSVAIKNLQSPDTPDATKPDTPYRVFCGGGALFEADGAPVKLAEVPDGTSNTILFVHATETVPWAKPQEFAYTRTTPLPPLGSPGMGKGFNVAFADGSVRFLRHTIAEADLRSLIEKADGRAVVIE